MTTFSKRKLLQAYSDIQDYIDITGNERRGFTLKDISGVLLEIGREFTTDEQENTLDAIDFVEIQKALEENDNYIQEVLDNIQKISDDKITTSRQKLENLRVFGIDFSKEATRRIEDTQKKLAPLKILGDIYTEMRSQATFVSEFDKNCVFISNIFGRVINYIDFLNNKKNIIGYTSCWSAKRIEESIDTEIKKLTMVYPLYNSPGKEGDYKYLFKAMKDAGFDPDYVSLNGNSMLENYEAKCKELAREQGKDFKEIIIMAMEEAREEMELTYIDGLLAQKAIEQEREKRMNKNQESSNFFEPIKRLFS
ncbi:hypothetical protein [Streptococcus merionis]|uniref:hypothetical protein n=1 Tax=Streptococcus merionis TaxID=400065 RepID=UPI0035191B23